MNEHEPFEGAGDLEPTKVPLRGPNASSTFDTPPHPDAVKAHEAAIRKHLEGRRPPDPPPAS